MDSNNLYQAVYSTKFVEDKRLRIDIAQVQEYVKRKVMQVRWIKADEMLADCLTKKGDDADKLMTVIKEGRLPEREEEGQKDKRKGEDKKKREEKRERDESGSR